MNLHEYQSKKLLAGFGVRIPRGVKVDTVEEATQAAEELGLPVVVKAQIHAGGRGKAGGVKLAKTMDEVKAHASDILGKKLVTPQTGAEGKEVRKLLIEEGLNIKQELYLSFLVDRSVGRPVCIASAAGGMEIEVHSRAAHQRGPFSRPSLNLYLVGGVLYSRNDLREP